MLACNAIFISGRHSLHVQEQGSTQAHPESPIQAGLQYQIAMICTCGCRRKGKAIILCVGGAREALLAEPNTFEIVLGRRTVRSYSPCAPLSHGCSRVRPMVMHGVT